MLEKQYFHVNSFQKPFCFHVWDGNVLLCGITKATLYLQVHSLRATHSALCTFSLVQVYRLLLYIKSASENGLCRGAVSIFAGS